MKQSIVKHYVDFLRNQGYAPRTIICYSTALGKVPDSWLLTSPEQLHEHITRTLMEEHPVWNNSVWHNIKPASALFFLQRTGMSYKVYKQSIVPTTVNTDIMIEFYKYSTGFKHLTQTSAKAECKHIEKFLFSLEEHPIEWKNITANEIKDYVSRVLSGVRPSSKGRYITSLRNFFRFLEYKGEIISPTILELPLAPAAWNKNKIPITLTIEEEDRLRGLYQANSSLEIKNRLIIQLMLDLGLRSSEISNLKLDDINWNKGSILICNTKNGKNRELPISTNLGQLLEKYVLCGCRDKQNPDLFQRKTIGNQFTAMSRDSVRAVIRYAFVKAQISGWWKGAHALRRTAASRLYNNGNGIKITADILGHTSLDSTTQYIRVDFNSLRLVGNPWPGGSNYVE